MKEKYLPETTAVRFAPFVERFQLQIIQNSLSLLLIHFVEHPMLLLFHSSRKVPFSVIKYFSFIRN